MAGICRKPVGRTIRVGAALGMAGGTAEIAWIALYGSLAGIDAAEVAGAISAAVNWVVPGVGLAGAPVLLGVAVHMFAAVAIGIALVFVWDLLPATRPARVNAYAFMLGALALVWAFNFFVVLPLIGPHIAGLQSTFAELVPYPASLASKLLFGLAGAFALKFTSGPRFAPIAIRTRRTPE
jgi:hypothetical protein